jgi:hypothetical protein
MKNSRLCKFLEAHWNCLGIGLKFTSKLLILMVFYKRLRFEHCQRPKVTENVHYFAIRLSKNLESNPAPVS